MLENTNRAPKKEKAMQYLVETLYNGYHHMDKHEPTEAFLWMCLGVIYHACSTGDGVFPTDEEVLGAIKKQKENNRDFHVNQEVEDKMLQFYHAVLLNRQVLLSSAPAQLASPAPRFIQMQTVAGNIKNITTNSNVKDAQFSHIPENSAHHRLIEKLQTRVMLLGIFEMIYTLTGYCADTHKEVSELKDYIQKLEDGAKNGLSVSAVTNNWKETHSDRKILQQNSHSWFYKPDESVASAVSEEPKFLQKKH